jgi:aspartate racemase
MNTIGVLGGMSAESTAIYYKLFNDEVRRRLGGLHSAELLIRSIDFAPVAAMQAEGQWEDAGALLARHALSLERAGAGLIVLATNTMHKIVDHITAAVSVPVVHIADATARALVAQGHRRPGLMATRFTMEDDFYIGRLREGFGLAPIVPDAPDRALTHAIIYDELCQGIVRDTSRKIYEGIARRIADAGADSLILGCTEVGLLLDAGNVPVPVFRLHWISP